MLHALEIVIGTPQVAARARIAVAKITHTGRLVGAELYLEAANANGTTTVDIHLGATIAGAVTVFGDQTRRPAVLPGATQGSSPAAAFPVNVVKGQWVVIDLDNVPPGGTGGVMVLTLYVDDGLFTRSSLTVVTGALADGASEDLLIPLGKAVIITRITVDRAARARFYSAAAYRAADAARPPGNLPSGEFGDILDANIPAANLVFDTSPSGLVVNKEAPPSADVPARIENKSGATATVSVTIDYIKLEG